MLTPSKKERKGNHPFLDVNQGNNKNRGEKGLVRVKGYRREKLGTPGQGKRRGFYLWVGMNPQIEKKTGEEPGEEESTARC